MNQPLVSVLMTVKNNEAWIGDALDSALSQSYENLEIVIGDNASTDGTPEILREYARREPDRVRLHLADDDIGPCGRRREAFDRSRGELVCWLDSDDIWLPGKVAKEVEVMQARPEVGLVYTGFEAFDSEQGAEVSWGYTQPRTGDHLVPLYVEGCFIPALTIMFRRRVLEDRGLTLRDSDWSFGDDHHLELVAALDWEIVGIDEVLARYRRHPSNESDHSGNYHVDRIRLLREYIRDYPAAKDRLRGHRHSGLAGHYRLAAGHEREHGSRVRALGYRAQAFVRDPVATARAPDSLFSRAPVALGRLLRRSPPDGA
jgi:glycosyltransferase involved in cell wall biosynthesis